MFHARLLWMKYAAASGEIPDDRPAAQDGGEMTPKGMVGMLWIAAMYGGLVGIVLRSAAAGLFATMGVVLATFLEHIEVEEDSGGDEA